MHFPSIQLLLVASLASAQRVRLVAGEQGTHDLVARQFVGYSNCSTQDSCGECFGDGWILCSNKGCFNPNRGQNCCKDGTLCVGWEDDCCDGIGPGVTGTDGPVPVPTDGGVRGPVITDGWNCYRDDTNEGCCTRGGPDIHWCSGEFPHQRCYNATNQLCCDEGTVCSGEDCCKIVNAVETTPAPYAAQISSTAAMQRTSGETGAPTASETQSETFSATDSAATTTESSGAGGVMDMAGSVIVVMLGAFGVVWL